jgi:hypothetical protein
MFSDFYLCYTTFCCSIVCEFLSWFACFLCVSGFKVTVQKENRGGGRPMRIEAPHAVFKRFEAGVIMNKNYIYVCLSVAQMGSKAN